MSEKTYKILLAEDDQNFGDVLKSYLEMHDFDVHLATDGALGWTAFQQNKFDLCILDVMMPKKDGFTLATDIRTLNTDVPIIFLTARSMKEDILEGFKSGADDYVSKPFNSEELLARIHAILKRSGSRDNGMESIKDFTIGKYTFNFPLRILTYNGDKENTEKLSPKEAELLRMFCFKKNDVLSRTEALTKIWGEENYFTARSMDVFITKLRKYLKRDPDIEIVNIHGNGFQLFVKEAKANG